MNRGLNINNANTNLISTADLCGHRVLGMSGSLTNYINTGNAGSSDTFSRSPNNLNVDKKSTNKKIDWIKIIKISVVALGACAGAALLYKKFAKGNISESFKGFISNLKKKTPQNAQEVTESPKNKGFFVKLKDKIKEFFTPLDKKPNQPIDSSDVVSPRRAQALDKLNKEQPYGDTPIILPENLADSLKDGAEKNSDEVVDSAEALSKNGVGKKTTKKRKTSQKRKSKPRSKTPKKPIDYLKNMPSVEPLSSDEMDEINKLCADVNADTPKNKRFGLVDYIEKKRGTTANNRQLAQNGLDRKCDMLLARESMPKKPKGTIIEPVDCLIKYTKEELSQKIADLKAKKLKSIIVPSGIQGQKVVYVEKQLYDEVEKLGFPYNIKGDNLIDILGLDDLAQGESYAIKYCTNPKYKTGINDPMLNKFKDFITVVRTPDGIFYTGYR